MKIPTITDTPFSIISEENAAVQPESLPSLLLRYLFWAGVISCLIGSVIGVRAFGIEFFPLRVVSLLALPFLLFNPAHKEKGIARFGSRLLIIMLIYGIASLSWSPDPQLGFRNVGLLFTGVVLFLLVTRHAIDRPVLTKIMIIWSIMIIGTSLLGAYETVRGEYLFSFDKSDIDIATAGRLRNAIGWLCPRVFWSNWNNFAFVNAISALVLTGWAFEARGGYRILALIATLLAIIMVMYTHSRAAVFGLLMGLMVFAFIFTIKSSINAFYRIVTILLMISLGVFLLYKGEELLYSSTPAYAMVTKIADSNDEKRIYYYTTAVIQGTLHSAGFGRGLGASTEIIGGGSYHNYLLEILAELGLWFFLGLFILLTKVCIQLWSAVREGRNRYWSLGLISSCFALPLLCMGPSSLLSEAPYWLWLAFVVSFAEYDANLMRLTHEQIQEGSIECTS